MTFIISDEHVKTRRSDARPMGTYALMMKGSWDAERVPAMNSGKPAAEINAFLDAISDARPTRVTCGLCDWAGFTGPAGVAREAGLQHRRDHHPETFRKRKRPSPSGLGTKPM